MSRSERRRRISEEQLLAWIEADLLKKEHDATRRKLTATALRRRRKDELCEMLVELCDRDVHFRWAVEARIKLAKPVELIVHDLREAISLATQVDESELNADTDYDAAAYGEARRLMEMLVSLGEIDEAMEVAEHLVERASHQLEFSDEGRMLDDVKECLQPLLGALESRDDEQRAAWAARMRQADSFGCICEVKLKSWS